MAFADRTHGIAGVTHRRVWVDDPAAGERLSPAFAAGGWEVQRLLVMVHHGEAEHDADTLSVGEIPERLLRPLRDELSRAYGYDEETRRQLLETQRQVAETLDVSFFGVRSEGRIVSGCELYSRGGVAQIEDVVTAPAHRNKGYGRAVVRRAVEAARSGGHDLVFLLAEEDDWPKDLYHRLGFEPIARLHGFLKQSV
jgi:GNAT superfamily N-acetyltransferase